MALSPWRPGESGNPGGRPKELLGPEIRKQLHLTDKKGVSNATKLAAVLMQQALTGNVKAAELILDRVDGKVPQDSRSDTYHHYSLEDLYAIRTRMRELTDGDSRPA